MNGNQRISLKAPVIELEKGEGRVGIHRYTVNSKCTYTVVLTVVLQHLL